MVTFENAVNFDVGDGASSVAVGDFDGDGNLDLATANSFDNNVSVLLGDGSDGFATQFTFAVGDAINSVLPLSCKIFPNKVLQFSLIK